MEADSAPLSSVYLCILNSSRCQFAMLARVSMPCRDGLKDGKPPYSYATLITFAISRFNLERLTPNGPKSVP